MRCQKISLPAAGITLNRHCPLIFFSELTSKCILVPLYRLAVIGAAVTLFILCSARGKSKKADAGSFCDLTLKRKGVCWLIGLVTGSQIYPLKAAEKK